MGRYILKRVLQMIPVLLGVTLLIFLLLNIAPGDPARLVLGTDASQEQLEQFREENGLNDPILLQYVRYMKNALTGDFGTSYVFRTSVTSLIRARVGASVSTMLIAIVLTIVLSLPLGIQMALKQNSLFDNFMRVFTLIFNSMPGFWLGLLMILFFSVKLGWLPSSGLETPSALIMPVICLGLSMLTPLSRAERSSMLEVIHQDYIRTARAKGLTRQYIIRHHALKNSLLPMITLYGKMIGTCFGGSVIIETTFGINGIGKMMRDSLTQKDLPAVMGCVIISTTLICVMNLVTDLLYGYVDPRIKSIYGKKKSGKGAKIETAKRKMTKVRTAAKPEPQTAVAGGCTAAQESVRQTATQKNFKRRSLWTDVWLRLRKNKTAILGFVLFAVIAIACFSAPLFYDYTEDIVTIAPAIRLQGPSAEHILGTDELGRDMLARILWGGRTSLICGELALCFSILIGGALGIVAAYYGGIADTLIMRGIDIVMAIPSILLMITLATIMTPNVINLALAIGIGLVPAEARLIRGQVLQVVDQEYIEAVKAQGASDLKIIFSHILPNSISPIITTIMMDMGSAITMISTLSFVGLGIQAPAPEWGTMLAAGRAVMRDAWHITTFPGLMLVLTVVALTLMGDGLRDALDPRMKR